MQSWSWILVARNMKKPKVSHSEFMETLAAIQSLSLREREFYMLIGLCIKEWAKIEDRLFDLCELVMRCDQATVSIVYYRTPTINSRLKLASELLRSRFPKRTRRNGGHDHPISIAWDKVEAELSGLFAIRNLLAHAPVEHKSHPVEVRRGPVRVLSSAETFEVRTSDKERLRDRDQLHSYRDSLLEQYLTQIRVVSKNINGFSEKLRSWLAE